MTAADIMRLEALRTTCLAAMHSCQSAVQCVEAMLITTDDPPPPNDDSTFDAPAPTTGVPNGKAKQRQRR